MAAKNFQNIKKSSPVGKSTLLILCVLMLVLTIVRLIMATSGALGESEALLCACARHPAAGYMEGPCGVPLLYTLLLLLKPLFGGSALLVLRGIPSLAALLLSWCVWILARRIAPLHPAVAFWSVIGVNLLPWVNLSTLVMDGGMVKASLILLSIIAAWNAVDSVAIKKNSRLKARSLGPWILFGITLALGTLFFYPIGFLLPAALLARYLRHRDQDIPWFGVISAFIFLTLGWLAPFTWNARHDWISWSSVAHDFDTYAIGGVLFSLSFSVLVSALLIPCLIKISLPNAWMRSVMLVMLIVVSAISIVVLAMPSELQGGYPSPLGVEGQGVGALAHDVLVLRKNRSDSRGEDPFLIAQSPGLAALLGEKIQINYPELPGAPSVFVAESPSLSSSYTLWPTYADAVAPVEKDILYSEEKTVSPFLGHNALYITAEEPNELPQTITGAFNAVGLLKEIQIIRNGQPEVIRIYQCEGYRSLSL